KMVEDSGLSNKVKNTYINAYKDKLRKMGMTQTMIAEAVNNEHPSVYAPTTVPLNLTFRNGTKITGYFDSSPQSDELKKENKYTFIELKNVENYKEHKSSEYMTIVEGDQLTDITYAQ
ncbi:hypothetical protein, partial [Flavihumibacter sp. CACIAM 22H1]|uniref:hypothetical protein n=1 Tax=Flavihumibacter sp. CACIAM 22H1 TaxID=1812911 RepID=UPI0025C137D7